jgi:HEAT repeat protein
VEALLNAIAHSGPSAQVAAIECLVRLKSVRAIPPLVTLLASLDASVRRAAAYGLKALEWVPVNNEQAIDHAIELEDWASVVAFGAEAVRPLMSVLKQTHGQTEREAAVLAAMSAFTDARAADELLIFCRDGEAAAAAVTALAGLVERSAAEISDETLRAMAELNNVVQFKFSIDPEYHRPVRSGIEFVNTECVRMLVAAELACRENQPLETETKGEAAA